MKTARLAASGWRSSPALAVLGGAAIALWSASCSRVPEQALKDEQARSRRYRDAYETQAVELQALKERVAALEKQRCAAAADAGEPEAPADAKH